MDLLGNGISKDVALAMLKKGMKAEKKKCICISIDDNDKMVFDLLDETFPDVIAGYNGEINSLKSELNKFKFK